MNGVVYRQAVYSLISPMTILKSCAYEVAFAYFFLWKGKKHTRKLNAVGTGPLRRVGCGANWREDQEWRGAERKWAEGPA